MGDGQAPSETLASPLLRQPQEVEEPMSKQRNTPLMDWWLRKWQLMLYTVLLLIASVGNTVFFKRMTNAMPNYGWYLTQLSTMIYVPFFACMAGTGITQQADVKLVKKFAIMGVFDGLSGTFMVLGGVHTSGTLQVLMGQAVIPVTMLLSVLLLRKQYHILQYVGATTIVLGIVLDKVMTPSGGLTEENWPVSNIFFAMAILPQAVSTVFKEIAFRGYDGDLDVNVLQFWVAVFQVAVNFICMPVYTLPMLGTQRVPLEEMPNIALGGSKCLFVGQDQVVENCGLPDEKPCDNCEKALVPVFMYLGFNLLLNIFAVLVIKHGSAALSFLVSTLRMPLSALAFSSTMIMGAEAAAFRLHDFMGLVTILLGLASYRLGSRQLKRQLKAEAAMTEQIPSPTFASPASPSDISDSPGVRPRGSDWKLMPVFATGSLNSGQPQFVLVHAPKPKARSADLVRRNLIGRVGVASPLSSPQFRHHFESREPHDMTLTGLES